MDFKLHYIIFHVPSQTIHGGYAYFFSMSEALEQIIHWNNTKPESFQYIPHKMERETKPAHLDYGHGQRED